MTGVFNPIKAFSLAVMLGFVGLTSVEAQNGFGRPTNLRVQLPVVSFFNVRTVVSVPDGGTMSLGGISSHAARRTTRGTGLGGPFFRNRGIGYSTGGSQASVTATIISNQEMGDALVAEGNRRVLSRQRFDPNGPAAVQSKADFISRNIGRSRR